MDIDVVVVMLSNLPEFPVHVEANYLVISL